MDGAANRDSGIERALSKSVEWQHETSVAFNWWLDNAAPREFTFEQFRNFLEACHFPAPHHPNAWGAMAKRFADRVKAVGYATSVRPQAHARLTRTYRRA